MSKQMIDREWRTGGSRVESGPLAYAPQPILAKPDSRNGGLARSLIRDLSDWSWPAQPAI